MAETTAEWKQAVSSREVALELEKTRWLGPVVLGLVAAAYCAWVLSLPVFPSQDGPMHLYLTRILQALLLHRDPGLYPQYFYVKHLLPPYALYYYLLMALGSFMPLVMADKVVICLYIVLFLFGFRFLARSLGPSGDAMALLATPLVLNWQLGMGFVNFCLSIALGMWALGLWCRVAARPAAPRNAWRLCGFVALCVAIAITHPVPLICVLGFCVVELVVRAWRQRRLGERTLPGGFVRDAVAFVAASTTLVYVKAFTTHNIAQQMDPDHRTYLQGLAHSARGILILGTTDIFSPHSVVNLARRASLLAIVVVGLVLGAVHLRQSLRRREWLLSDTWFAIAVVWGIAVPVMPPDLNSAHFFSARLMIFAVIAVLAAASGSKLAATPRAMALCVTAMVVMLAITLRAAVVYINPIARQMAELEVRRPGETPSLYLSVASSGYYGISKTVTFDPYIWSPVRVVRRSDSILYDVPWLNQPHLPVGSLPNMPTGRLDQNSLEAPELLRRRMLASPSMRALLFGPVDHLILNSGIGPKPDGAYPLAELDPYPNHHWNCGQEEFLTVCSLAKSGAGASGYNQGK
jgi:hypothetical protein